MLHKLARMRAEMGENKQCWLGIGDENCQRKITELVRIFYTVMIYVIISINEW